MGNAGALQRRTLEETGHRPWPLPEGAWFQGQTWCDLLFAHWRVPPEQLRRVMPDTLPLHLYEDGSAWIGVTPFVVTGLRPRGTPLPWVSRFPELNVRTYVELGGKPGIYFLSLDAARRAAVVAARRLYRLPYFHALAAPARRARARRAGNGGSGRHRPGGRPSTPLQRQAGHPDLAAEARLVSGAVTRTARCQYEVGPRPRG